MGQEVRFVVHPLVEENAVILGAPRTREYWRFERSFPIGRASRPPTSSASAGIWRLTIDSTYEVTAERHGRFELTAEQSEALVVAVDRGSFDVLWGATMDDLATGPDRPSPNGSGAYTNPSSGARRRSATKRTDDASSPSERWWFRT